MRVLTIVGTLVPILGLTAPVLAQEARGTSIQAEELFRLGGLSAPSEEEFTDQRLSLSLGPNDQLFVLDLSASRIQVFSAQNGEYIRTIGRPGRGPGEILDATGLGFDSEDHLWVKEPFARRFSIFDSTGTFLRTVPRPFAAVPKLTGRVGFDPEGRVLDVASHDAAVVIRVLSPASGDVLELFEPLPSVALPESVPRILAGLPEDVVEALRRFRPQIRWGWSSDGRVWFARTDEYRLFQVGPAGDTVRTLTGPGGRAEFSRKERGLVDRAHHHIGSTELGLAPQQLQSVIELPDGRVLVQRPAELNEPGSRFDVFGLDGRIRSQLHLPMPIWPRAGVALRDDRLFLVGRGEYDVPVILALSIPREGGL